jgi:hypothetical protein
MAPDVIHARAVFGTVLEIGFADGTVRHVDVASIVRPEGVFAGVRSPGFVAQARVNPDTGTVEWPSGADLSPEVLYVSGQLVRSGSTTAA